MLQDTFSRLALEPGSDASEEVWSEPGFLDRLDRDLRSRLQDLRQASRIRPHLLLRIEKLEQRAGVFLDLARDYVQLAEPGPAPMALMEFLDLFDRTTVDILQEVHLREIGGQG